MIETEWLRDGEVLAVRPSGRIGRDDFAKVGALVDPAIAEKGRLEGLLVDTRGFSGWEDANALIEHLRFAGQRQPKVARIAAVGDHWWLQAAPAMEPFFGTPVRVFRAGEEGAARAWLLETPPEPAAITVLPESEGNIVEVHVRGRLRDADYGELRRELERRLEGGGKIRLLAVMDETFRGWTPKAALDDIAFAFSPWNRRFEKLAIVSGPGLVSWCARNFPADFMPYPIRAFEPAELDRAKSWLRE